MNIITNCNSAAASIHQEATSFLNDGSNQKVISCVSDVFKILFLREVNRLGTQLGQKLSIWSGGNLQLNNFVPHFLRHECREFAKKFAIPMITKLGNGIAYCTGIDAGKARTVIAAPIVEELIYRLPLLGTAWVIDTYLSDSVLGKPLSNVVNLTGTGLLKGITAVFLSIAFTYGHGENLSPGRAMGIFYSGMALSGMVLQSGLRGYAVSTSSHSVHNLRCVFNLSLADTAAKSQDQESSQKKSVEELD